MSYECCKGLYTIPCEFCYRQICPTDGHNQRFQVGEKDACEECKYEKDWKPNNKRKKYQSLYNKISKVVENYEECQQIKRILEQKSGINLSDDVLSNSESDESS